MERVGITRSRWIQAMCRKQNDEELVISRRYKNEKWQKGKGLQSTNWQLRNSHRDVKYSRGNIVSDVVVTVCVGPGVLDFLGDHFVSYIGVSSLCCTPKAKMILNVNCKYFY